MKRKINELGDLTPLSMMEMNDIRGGFFRTGPGDVVADDIDIPDLRSATGPGGVVEDDIDIPDLDMATAIGKVLGASQVSFSL
jgi:hypothetical protein